MARGFTLLETLIALVIASVTALVLLQSIMAVARNTAGLNSAVSRALEGEFSRGAVGDALSASMAEYLDSEDVFAGSAEALSGLTRRPVFAAHGGPVAFALSLRDDAGGQALVYQEGSHEVVAMRFEVAAAEFRYAYQTLTGLYAHEAPQPLDVWPPEAGFDPWHDYYRPPPDLVMIVDSDDRILWASALTGWHAPPMRGVDLEQVL